MFQLCVRVKRLLCSVCIAGVSLCHIAATPPHQALRAITPALIQRNYLCRQMSSLSCKKCLVYHRSVCVLFANCISTEKHYSTYCFCCVLIFALCWMSCHELKTWSLFTGYNCTNSKIKFKWNNYSFFWFFRWIWFSIVELSSVDCVLCECIILIYIHTHTHTNH